MIWYESPALNLENEAKVDRQKEVLCACTLSVVPPRNCHACNMSSESQTVYNQRDRAQNSQLTTTDGNKITNRLENVEPFAFSSYSITGDHS